ncbi:hypothetical protein [Pinibacter soli]|uniref:Gliding motility-associated protein GldM C-terminal domain-containing protein n=1 Tax=Pinibacter soli TaxID=3044211 RepID=A0ABT6RHS1_9BACT|nr:hypothetical protein [Pinibacter soli]MDI3322121.1 hypothetical protein [Pinibacter soli]
MKPSLVYIILLFSLKIYAQVSIKNTSLIKPDTNVLAYGSENILVVSGTSAKVDLVSRVGNAVTPTGSNQFAIRARNLNPDTLSVLSGKKLLLKKTFLIDTTFSIKVHVGNITNDTATVGEILANGGIKIVVNSLRNKPLSIVGFYTTFIGPASDTLAKLIQHNGNLFSSEQQTVIRGLTKNSKIMIDVVLRGSDSRDRAVGPYFIFVK